MEEEKNPFLKMPPFTPVAQTQFADRARWGAGAPPLSPRGLAGLAPVHPQKKQSGTPATLPRKKEKYGQAPPDTAYSRIGTHSCPLIAGRRPWPPSALMGG